MELGLSLGDTPNLLPFSFLDTTNDKKVKNLNSNKDLGFYIGLSLSTTQGNTTKLLPSLEDPASLQLAHLLPMPQQRLLPWLTTQNLRSEEDSSTTPGKPVNQLLPVIAAEEELESEEVVSLSSQKSIESNFQMELSNVYKSSTKSNNKRGEYSKAMTISGDEEEEENGSTRKKLRLSKDQSAFLEDSFKDHHTLSPKQKLALAKQLNLRPRQVEVWFQNRRARTKLKQTEVDCEYLKRCRDTLTEENRKLMKELQELRALKSSQPYFMQLPPTTLTMCPSCERVSSSTTNTTISTISIDSNTLVAKPVLHPFIKHARDTTS